MKGMKMDKKSLKDMPMMGKKMMENGKMDKDCDMMQGKKAPSSKSASKKAPIVKKPVVKGVKKK